MTKNLIVDKIYREGTIKQIINNIAHGLEDKDDLDDLCQDVAIILLSKDDNLIIHLYDKNEINYYIANIVYTQLRSSTSPYYRTYKHYKNMSIELEDVHNYNED